MKQNPETSSFTFNHEDLQVGIERGEFEPHYQPIINSSGRWQGAEILLCWNHPRHGVLLPPAFLDMMENTGLLVDATRAMLARTALQWRYFGRKLCAPFFISLNASPMYLKHASLEDDYCNCIATIDNQHVEVMVDMPEYGADFDARYCVTLFNQLEDTGILLAIDDFGVEDACLHQFACGKISCVKIDRALVTEIEINQSYRQLISKVVEFSTAFGARVVAEGVETTRQRQCLCKLGVHFFQGYLFEKPLPADEFFSRLSTRHAGL